MCRSRKKTGKKYKKEIPGHTDLVFRTKNQGSVNVMDRVIDVPFSSRRDQPVTGDPFFQLRRIDRIVKDEQFALAIPNRGPYFRACLVVLEMDNLTMIGDLEAVCSGIDIILFEHADALVLTLALGQGGDGCCSDGFSGKAPVLRSALRGESSRHAADAPPDRNRKR